MFASIGFSACKMMHLPGGKDNKESLNPVGSWGRAGVIKEASLPVNLLIGFMGVYCGPQTLGRGMRNA